MMVGISILLPLMIAVPIFALAITILINKKFSYNISIIASLIVFALSIAALAATHLYGFQALDFSSHYIPQLNLSFDLRLTQPSLILLVMTTIVFLAASLVGKYFIGERERLYNFIFLIALSSSIGVFLSANLFLFYVFWEIAEVMMFFIIFIYGGYNRRYASIKFLIYSLFSSLLLLIGILMLYNGVTPHSFDIAAIAQGAATIPIKTQILVIILFVLSFMIKMPVFPFHSWLPDAHTEAPTPGSMILAGVLLKFGSYGLFLMFLMLPIASAYVQYLFIILVFSTIYSSLVCLGQTNIKRLIAYTSITDMGIIGVGITAMNVFGTNGAFYAMLSHGIAISILFLVAGTLDELYGTLEIAKIKGVIKHFADLSYTFIFGVFAALGIPLTAGFIADFLLFIGAIKAFGVYGILPLAGIFIIGAALFWVIERMFMSASKANEPYNPLDRSVIASGVFLLASAVVLGIIPFTLL